MLVHRAVGVVSLFTLLSLSCQFVCCGHGAGLTDCLSLVMMNPHFSRFLLIVLSSLWVIFLSNSVRRSSLKERSTTLDFKVSSVCVYFGDRA